MDFSFLILLLLVAILYSSVGHGGASGYLALMALWGFAPETMRPWALTLNICVSLIAALQFFRKEAPDWKLFASLIIGSIPAAYWGASVQMDQDLYKKILGGLVIFQSIRLLIVNSRTDYSSQKNPNYLLSILAGSTIGLLSGLIGIGGGIILSPLLIQLRWATMKQTALLSAGFIFVNSISALFALPTLSSLTDTNLLWALTVVIGGGLLGSWLGSSRMNHKSMRIILGIVLLIAGTKLLLG
ncbi:MAG: TSUP family transporter [Bacteroidota bacterium]|jgi:uncharacterized membrane protein YfcA